MIPPAPGARLAGKIALGAGAGSSAAGWSIGKASCVTLARQGAAIIALDADLAAAEDAAHEVERAGGQALPVQADGEIIGETPVEVTVVPRALRVVVPQETGTKSS